MREIRECTAEVFRRSEKRIKERKRNRIRMLVLCIPACLLVTAFSVMILPSMMPAAPAQDDPIDLFFSLEDSTDGVAADADSADSMTETVGVADESFACPYMAVEIRSGDSEAADMEKVTDQAAVTNLYDVIQSLFDEADKAEASFDESFEADGDIAQDRPWPPIERKAYTILFTAEDESQTIYHLNGNALLNEETGETAILSDTQVAKLLIVLGISE